MKNKIYTLTSKFKCAAILAVGAGLGFFTCATASTDVVWTNAAANGSWTTAGNWSGTAVYPNGDYNVSNSTNASAVLPAAAAISINQWNPVSGYTWSVILGSNATFAVNTANIIGGTQILRGDGTVSMGTLNITGGTLQTFNTALNLKCLNADAVNMSGGALFIMTSASFNNLGLVTFKGTAAKQIILITSYNNSSSYAQTTTIAGLVSESGTANSVLGGGNGKTGYLSTATAALNVASGASYSANLAMRDGANSLLIIDKYGAGTQVLTGSTSTYAGGTYVHEGALLVGNTAGSGVGYGNVTVSGGTFGGNGRVALNSGNGVTLNNGATLLAGDGVNANALTMVSTNLTMNTGSEISFLLQEAANSSLVRSGTGTWTFDADQLIRFIDDGATVGQTYTLITGLGSIVDVSGWTVANADWNGVFEYNSGAVTYTLASIPEPAVAGLIVSACFGLVVLVRSRRRG